MMTKLLVSGVILLSSSGVLQRRVYAIHIFLPVVVTNICAAAAQLFLSSFQPIRDALPRGICNLAANPDNDLSHHHEMFVTS
jgi:hypothetical protein